MSIEQSQFEPAQIPLNSFLKPTHRTKAEQWVGLGIFLSISLGIQLIGMGSNALLTALNSSFLAFAMWTLWRSHSLRILKLELSLFLAQIFFQVSWNISHFVLHEMLLALVLILLLCFNTLIAALLFWRKERLAGALFLFPLAWGFYLAGLNMVTCISNP